MVKNIRWITFLLIVGMFTTGCNSSSRVIDRDFDDLHSIVNDDGNTYLIFGNVPTPEPAADLSPDLAVFLGRWEGYDYGPPVKKDYKFVLVVTEITTHKGKALLWLATNLQYPVVLQQIDFKVIEDTSPAIEFKVSMFGKKQNIRLIYNAEKRMLTAPDASYRPVELGQTSSFYVYKDYGKYLAGLGIKAEDYQDTSLSKYGKGYMVYLPEGYADHPSQTWPMIFFLHGSGDRGDNPLLLAKASPFMTIRESGPLPFIIIAPLLDSPYNSFPNDYLDGVLAEVYSTYRVDQSRVYLSGLSMGARDAYGIAIRHPELFAAIVAVSGYADPKDLPDITRIKNIPVWAIHGAEDTIVPLNLDQQGVDALQKVGGNVRFDILADHDHDTWTDTYSDPAFYDWLLQYQTQQ